MKELRKCKKGCIDTIRQLERNMVMMMKKGLKNRRENDKMSNLEKEKFIEEIKIFYFRHETKQ